MLSDNGPEADLLGFSIHAILKIEFARKLLFLTNPIRFPRRKTVRPAVL